MAKNKKDKNGDKGSKGKPKKGGKGGSSWLADDTVELHLPDALYTRVMAMNKDDVGEILKLLFDCHPETGERIFEIKNIKLYKAAMHDLTSSVFDPTKVCDGP